MTHAVSPVDRGPVLLIGAGHAHLHLIQQRQRLPAAEVMLVDPGGFWYSGMATGVLGHQYSPGEDRLDPRRLARRHGVEALRGRLSGLDVGRREALLDDGRRLPFSVLSLNLGSRTPCPAPHPQGPAVWPVKPIPCLVALRHRLTRELEAGRQPRIVVVGGGASGVEVACNLWAQARHHRGQVDIRLVTRGQRLLEGAPRGAVSWLAGYLARRGIRVSTSLEVRGHAAGGLMVASLDQPWGEDSYRHLEADHVVHAAGLAPPPVLDCLGLPTLAGRGLAVTETLQSPQAPWAFAAGDCAAMLHQRLPRLGVYGVRQAPVLRANIAAHLMGGPLQAYRPQPRALAILNLGQGQALAIRGRRWWGGRLAMLWKRWLDARFLAGYRRGGPPAP
ncbi:NAD(P)/FAD-dependent oxidoreductase [Halomonas nitroreducens]|uniref:Pyridine nucleotide-disulfide oxidoreductase n=1 Tax=Halomonas nitroreducens TaxID=447425 RepID=A0A3S0JY90_9GAMM|nr:FAD-dependent oxidoreductase [Halomonas nitroreducens]RTR04959.1 pyridine nucleotide-disulfide oxidoreductase [Halomonas nitroreducens]